jgi:hypothetical protein
MATGTGGAGGEGGAGGGDTGGAGGTGMGGAGGAGGAGMGGAGGGSADVEECLKQAGNDACAQCACNNCIEELKKCEDDEGCKAIRQCAQDNMCSGFGCLQPCGDTINMYGGVGGPSAMLALELSQCVDMNCQQQCM